MSNILKIFLEELSSHGYSYIDDTGVSMVEHHVDDHPSFHERMNQIPFGGKLSVRLNDGERPLIIFGQDESIFKQYLMKSKAWTCPDGETQMVPKDEGAGIMISAFVSRDFGYGYPELTTDQLKQVNDNRKNKNYQDEEAAKQINGDARKRPLKTHPFSIEFEHGKNEEGYWTYERMILQLEDCVDVLTTLHPSYDFKFLFDHSCGHDKQRPDALNVHSMNKEFAGKQTPMHNSHIKQHDGYLGPFPRKINVGDTQSMIFSAEDEGPYYLSPRERESMREDRIIGVKIHKFTVSELRSKLLATGVRNPPRRASKLKEMCTEKAIPLQKEVPKIQEGWVGKPKGKLQILFERGFIDVSKGANYYTNKGKKDDSGLVDLDSSLDHLLSTCTDFNQEESMLQFVGRKLGISVDHSPVCHAELAGEGIEYVWGARKKQVPSIIFVREEKD